MDPNDECELYEFSLHIIRELHITNREYAHSVAALSNATNATCNVLRWKLITPVDLC